MPNIHLSDFKGINNKAHRSKMPEGYLAEAVDCFIENSLMLVKREGVEQLDTAIFSCIWSDGLRCFAVRNGDLIKITDITYQDNNGFTYQLRADGGFQLNSDGGYQVRGTIETESVSIEYTTILANIGYVKLAFCKCHDDYYYTCATVNGRINQNEIHQSIGFEQVDTQPTRAAIAGTMEAGVYMIAVTTLSVGGKESGTVDPVRITLTANQAIRLTGIFVSTNARVDRIAIYCSTANGSELYRQVTIANGVTTYDITSVNPHTYPLTTIGITPAPLGSLIAYHYAHLYIAADKFLFYCEKLRYEKWKPQNNYQYPSNITAIMPCLSGMWIGTEKDGLFWWSGMSPKHGKDAPGDVNQTKRHNACIFADSVKEIPAEFIGDGAPLNGWMATAKEGIFLLMDGGQFTLTSSSINMPAFDNAIGAIIEDSDSYKYAVIVSGVDVPIRTI
jgi:hypothetical protein